MAKLHLHPDFREFLKLLNAYKVHYLLIGGYAVAYYGYPRATGDMDIWINPVSQNAEKLIQVLRDFGFHSDNLNQDLFLQPDKIFRMGVPPLRIELLTGISGLNFEQSYQNRIQVLLDDVPVCMISQDDLIQNNKASGRPRDLDDLFHLTGD